MNFDSPYNNISQHPLPRNPPLVLSAQTGQFVPLTNFIHAGEHPQQLVAPPGYSFVNAQVLPVQNNVHTMQYLNIQQHIQHQRQTINHPENHAPPSENKYHCTRDVDEIANNPDLMKICEIESPEMVAAKATRFIYLDKTEKEFLKGQLVENVYLVLQCLFRKAKCLVGNVEGRGHVTTFKIYKFKDLHYALSMFELAVEHIQINEMSMRVDMKKGRFYRYGIEFKIVVDEGEIQALTEILQLLKLRPVFVKGKALKEEPPVDLSPKDIEKNRSRPHVEPQDSQYKPRSPSPKTTTGKLLRSFNCLSIDVGGTPMHLDIQMGPEDNVKISDDSLNRLKRSVSNKKSLCAERGFKSVSMENFVNSVSNTTIKNSSSRVCLNSSSDSLPKVEPSLTNYDSVNSLSREQKQIESSGSNKSSRSNKSLTT